MQLRLLCMIIIIVTQFTSFAYAKDVNSLTSNWYDTAINYMNTNDLDNSLFGEGFNSDDSLTRSQMWALLKNLDAYINHNDTSNEDAFEWVVKNNISDGTDPELILSRQEMISMLYRYEQSKGRGLFGCYMINIGDVYKDAEDIDGWSLEPIIWAKFNSIMIGTDEGLILPKESATNAQTAEMIMNYLKYIENIAK